MPIALLALSLSLGVAHAPRHATGIRELYAAAAQALYRAKSDGRGGVQPADPARPPGYDSEAGSTAASGSAAASSLLLMRSFSSLPGLT